jgi:sugar phosphate isomerase/epimerase
MDGAYAALKGRVRHAHIHDCEAPGDNIRFAQPGKGIIDHKRALELLMADGADIFMSFEWIGMGPAAAHLPQGLAAMKAFEEEIRKERALK